MKQKIFAKWLLAITTTHMVLGLIIFHPALLQLLQQGWWGTVGPENLETAIAFWFMFFGFPLCMLISCMWGSELKVKRPFLLVSLTGSIVAGLAIPASGIWALTILALVVLCRTQSED